MLFLQLKEGEYVTIGEDIVVQVFPDSASMTRLAIKAPRDMTILRGEVLERNGENRPPCLYGPKPAKRQKDGPKGRPGPGPGKTVSSG